MKRPFASPKSPHPELDLLSAYLDQEATQVEQARVESHLTTCAACRAELESLRRTVTLLSALPRVPVPRAFTLSEVQVGRRGAAVRSGWQGGLLRGLGAVTALALVVVLTATLVSRPGWTPGGMVARQAPELEPTSTLAFEAAGEPETARVAVPEAAVPAAEEQAAEEGVVEESAPAAAAVAASPMPAQPPTEAADASQPEVTALEAPAPAESEAASAPMTLAQESSPTENVQALQAPAPEADSSTEAPAVTPEDSQLALVPDSMTAPAAKAAPDAVPETPLAGMPMGRGGGGEGFGGAAASAMLPGEALTPEPTPAVAAVTEVLPVAVRVAYTDYKSLWAIDRSAGLRKLLDAEMVMTPSLSPDGAWVVHRVLRENYAEVWSVRWDGSERRMLLDERTLPAENLAPNYTERRIQDVRWIPGQAALAVTLTSVPVPGGMPRTELWRLDVATLELTFVADMGRALAPVYSPDGTRFALLEYGTETQPQGTLTLFSMDGRERRVALSFPASPAKLMFDSQLQWLPNSRGLWLAIPTADPIGPTAITDMNGATLYRIPVTGDVVTVGVIRAYQVHWSPDGAKLAYTRAVGEAGDTLELYLAAADGSAAQLYSPIRNGVFLSWSPDSTSFLYQDAYEVYVGTAGRKQQRLGNMVSVFDPRWAANRQVLSRHDTGSGWLLTLRGVDGSAFGLLPLPREAELDIVRR
jgi:hypothetical protein